MKKLYFYLAITMGSIFPSFAQTGTWTALSSGTTTDLIGLAAPTPLICYVCGNAGMIKKTIDGGMTWTTQTSGTSQGLTFMYFLDPLRGFAVGDNGTALKTTDGGTTWTLLSTGTSTEDFRGVYFADANTGYISGGISGSYGSVRKTTD